MIQSIYHFHSKEGINMNKIYKVIWSKAKHTYVVASEIAKGHTKGETTGRGLKKLAAAMLVAAALLSPNFVWAADMVKVDESASDTAVEVYTKKELIHKSMLQKLILIVKWQLKNTPVKPPILRSSRL